MRLFPVLFVFNWFISSWKFFNEFLISSYASFNKFILVHKTNGIIWLIGFNVVSLGMQETTKLNKTSKLKKFVYWYNIVKGKNVILKIE